MLVPMVGTNLRFRVKGLLICLLLSGCRSSKGNPEGVKHQLASAIRPRASSSQVLDYLNAQKIGHSPYHRDTTSGNVIEAEVSVKSEWNLMDPSFDIVFRFDDDACLIAYDVQSLGYVGL